MIRVIFFSLDVLTDRDALRHGVSEQMAQIMARRYSAPAAAWTAARRRVVADWDAYYADLNLSGDDGVADMWEGDFRTTRALFRLANVPEPPKAELTALSRELAALAASACRSALRPDVPEALRQLTGAGFALGALTHSSAAFLRGVLSGGGVLPLFSAPLIGTDTAERFEWDAAYFALVARLAAVAASACLVVDARADVLAQAQTAAMQTAQVERASDGGLLALAISLASRSG